MKNSISALAAALSAVCLTWSCQTTAPYENGNGFRQLTVTTDNVGTRTSIENEYSDWTHLVWDDGDRVAYVTDCAGDAAKVAEVMPDGTFTAEIPENASTLYVAYPAAGLEGRSLAELRLEIASAQTQTDMKSSKGITIPMYASAAVPATGATSVSVKYKIPVATVRFEFSSVEYAADQIRSVTMRAETPLTGTVSVSDGDFSGMSETMTTTVLSDGQTTPVSEGGHVYLPVKKGSYDNVTVTVVTDNNTFNFTGGKFALDDPDASLYKVKITLGKEAAAPPVPYFAEITAGEQFSAENKYLVTYKQSSSSYRVASKHISSKINAKAFEADADLGGIPAEGEVLDYVFTIAPVSGTEGKYYFYSEAAGNTNGKYIGTAGGTSVAGNFFFMQTEPAANDTYYIWDITFGDGVQYVYNEGRSRYFKYSDSLKQFVTSSVGEDNTGNEAIKDITILKLIE